MPNTTTPHVLFISPGVLGPDLFDPIIKHLTPETTTQIFDLNQVGTFTMAGLDSSITPPTLDELAAPVAERIVSDNVTAVVGWSLGGHVAAKAIELSGRTPHWIALDTAAPKIIPDSFNMGERLDRWFADFLGARAGTSIDYDPEKLREEGYTYLLEPA